MQSTELTLNQFSYFDTFNSLLVKKNLHHACKITSSWLTAQAMRLTFDAKTDIYLAIHVNHRLYKVFALSDRLNFGECLLISSRNIAKKPVLQKEEDKRAYALLKRKLFEAKEANNLESIIGYNKNCFTDEYLVSLHPDAPLKSANRTGLCASTSLYLIGKILDLHEFDENTLVDLLREIQKGVPGDVAAKQEIYQEFDFDIVGIKLFDISQEASRTHFVTGTAELLLDRAERLEIAVKQNLEKVIITIIDRIQNNEENGITPFHVTQSEVFRELAKENDPFFSHLLNNFDPKAILKAEKYKRNALAHLYGFKQDLEGTFTNTSALGEESNFASTKEHLKNYEKVEDGIYQISFKTLDEMHSLVYIKRQDGNGYFFDPNKGLIKCGEYNHANVLLKLLSTYPPPSDRLTQENNDRNYQINLTKYSKIRKPMRQ